jgi:hypothetical protein
LNEIEEFGIGGSESKQKEKSQTRLEERAGWLARKRERQLQKSRPSMQMYSDEMNRSGGEALISRVDAKKRTASDLDESSSSDTEHGRPVVRTTFGGSNHNTPAKRLK